MCAMAIGDVELELLKAALTGGIALLTLILGWFVGQRLTHQWAIRQKRRESELSAANEFYRLYGEFFAVWKIWNCSRDEGRRSSSLAASRWDILNRAAAAEAGIEAILVKLASERVLSDLEINDLGRFRQAYQSLRETIRDDEPVKWSSSEHPEYATFKRLACRVANMLFSGDQREPPTAEQAHEALRRITSNRWEGDWVDQASFGVFPLPLP